MVEVAHSGGMYVCIQKLELEGITVKFIYMYIILVLFDNRLIKTVSKMYGLESKYEENN